MMDVLINNFRFGPSVSTYHCRIGLQNTSGLGSKGHRSHLAINAMGGNHFIVCSILTLGWARCQ